MANWKRVDTSAGKMDAYWPGKAADRTEGMSVEGTYVEKVPVRRPDGEESHLWVLEDGEKRIGVNSAAGLDRAMETISPKSLVRITFLGKKMGKNGRQFNDFQVDVAETSDEVTSREQAGTETSTSAIPF